MNNVGVKIYVTGLTVNAVGELELTDKSFKEVRVGKIQTREPEINKTNDSIERM